MLQRFEMTLLFEENLLSVADTDMRGWLKVATGLGTSLRIGWEPNLCRRAMPSRLASEGTD
jgi:hypothetical protein